MRNNVPVRLLTTVPPQSVIWCERDLTLQIFCYPNAATLVMQGRREHVDVWHVTILILDIYVVVESVSRMLPEHAMFS